MYSKVIILLLLNIVVVFSQTTCDCSEDKIEQSIKESNDIVGFLNELADRDVPDEERYPVVPPNVITGMLACDCKENFRRKRTIFGKDVTEKPRPKPTPRVYSKRNCPKGYSRIGPICMPQSLLL